MNLETLALGIWALAWGVNVFLANEVIRVVAGVAAIVTGVLVLTSL